jgi:hypothetical protein
VVTDKPIRGLLRVTFWLAVAARILPAAKVDAAFVGTLRRCFPRASAVESFVPDAKRLRYASKRRNFPA